MTEFNDLVTYNGGRIHDTWMDFNNSTNIGFSYILFFRVKRQVGYDKTDINNHIDNLNDWDI